MKRIQPTMLALVCGLSLSAPSWAVVDPNADWKPELTERIFRLPPEQMQQAIQRDFSRSDLAQSLRSAVEELSDSQERIEQIQGQKSAVQGEMALEIRHQEVLAKKTYLDALSTKIALERKQLQTKRNFLARIQRDIRRDAFQRNGTRDVSNLRATVKTKIDAVDIDLTTFEQPGDVNSTNRFRAQYDQSLDALKTLKAAIASHQMNQTGRDVPVDRSERIAYMLNDVDTELAALQMQEEMLLHMVKLLSLDTMQLAQDVEVYDLESGDGSLNPLIDDQVPDINLFLSQN